MADSSLLESKQAIASLPAAAPRRRLVSIQICRGIAALAVVLAHLHNVEAKYFPTHLLMLGQFGVLGVDLFFVISGVVIAAVTRGRFGDRRYAGRFLIHRALRIYPLYWVYTLVVLASLQVNPHLLRANMAHAVDFAGSFTLYPRGLPFLVLQGWTLSYEVCFYVAMVVVLLLPPRFMPWLLTAWSAAAVALPLCGWVPPSMLMYFYTNPTILEFVAGILLFYILREARLHPGIGIGLIVAALLVLVAAMAWTARFHALNQLWIEHTPWRRTPIYGAFAVLFLAGAMELERTGIVRFAKPLQRIGDWSYSIYLSHLIVLEGVAHLFVHLLPGRHFGMLAVLAVSVPSVLVVGWLSYRWLEQPLIRWLHRI